MLYQDPVKKIVEEFKKKIAFGEDIFKKSVNAVVDFLEDSIDKVL
jgi:hypothetical protein